MIKDYWIYQKRNVQVPWSLYVVKEYDVNQPSDYDVLDYTFYSELIDNKAKSVSKVGLNYQTLDDYVEDIADTIKRFTKVTREDYEQLARELFYILRN
jgi:hypothetical protein